MADDSILFTPTRLGEVALANRMVMAPMTRNRAPDNLPNALMADYYAQRAGAGLIMTEGTTPSSAGRGYIDIPGLYSPAQVAGWRRVTDGVHARGGKIAVQVMHTGRISHPEFLDGAQAVAPSAVAAAGEIVTKAGTRALPVPRALTEAEIEQTIADYAAAARNAIEAGFDAVELHAANGYLPSQFLAPNANRRTDAWGGSIPNRARFALAALDAMVAAIGAGRVGIRVSPGGTFNDIQDPDVEGTYAHLFAEFGRRDIAWLHLAGTDPGFDLPRLARSAGAPIVLNGGYDRARAEAHLAAGLGEAVSFGATFIANPDLPERLRRNAALNAPDRATFYGGTAQGYTDYPALAA
jgi:N-ethylmaleimide reductase